MESAGHHANRNAAPGGKEYETEGVVSAPGEHRAQISAQPPSHPDTSGYIAAPCKSDHRETTSSAAAARPPDSSPFPVYFLDSDLDHNRELSRHRAATTRLEKLLAFQSLIDTGKTPKRAAREVGAGLSTLYVWSNLALSAGADWRLEDQRQAAIAALMPSPARRGRTKRWSMILEQPAALQKIETHYLATIGASGDNMLTGRRTGKAITALKLFATEPECPPLLARDIRLGKFPSVLLGHLKRITPAIEQRARGHKHFQLHGHLSRRDKTARLPDGSRYDTDNNFLWELDDMSSNQPFFVDAPEGPLLSRQGLYCISVKSARWMGVDLIARPREAYRAADILRFLRKLFTHYGKPNYIRLEKGVWASRSIRGYKIEDGEAVVADCQVRPAMADDERRALADGLEAIGVKIIYAYSAHHKVIETNFNYLQTILAAKTTDFVNIGRHAGEFEHGAKQVRRVRAGSHTPRQLSFAPMDTLADRIVLAYEFINSQPEPGAAPGTPSRDEIYHADTLKNPRPALTETDLAVFLPELRRRRINGGLVTCWVAGKAHDFRALEFAELGHGYKISVKFDPDEPTLGAAIYNRQTGPANFKNYRIGEFICFAPWEMPAPMVELQDPSGLDAVDLQVRYGRGAVDRRDDIRKAQDRFVRTAYRAMPRPGQPAVKIAEERSPQGSNGERERGSEKASDPRLSPPTSDLSSREIARANRRSLARIAAQLTESTQ